MIEVVAGNGDGDEILLGHGRENIDIALDGRVLGNQRDRLIEFSANLQYRTRDFQLTLDRLIGIRVDADHQFFALIAGFRKFTAQQFRRVHLREDACFEVDAG